MILVDSDVLIAHLRAHDAARDWLTDARRRTGRLATSVVSVAEITGGMRTGERRDVVRLLDTLHTLPVDDAVARRAGELRRRFHRSHHTIGIADYLIAATARGPRLQPRHAEHPALPHVRGPVRALRMVTATTPPVRNGRAVSGSANFPRISARSPRAGPWRPRPGRRPR